MLTRRFRPAGGWWLILPALLAIMMLAPEAIGDEVRLKSGDVLRGDIVARTGSHVVLKHPDLGRMAIPADRIDSLSPPPPAEGSRPSSAEAPSEPSSGRSGPAKEAEWTVSAFLGGSYTNDDEGPDFDLSSRLSVARKLPDSSTSLALRYIYGHKNREDTDNSFTSILTQEWFEADSPWSWVARARYDYDSFRSWRQRVTAHGGIKYGFIDEENLRIYALAGLGGRKDFGSENEDLLPEGALGIGLHWKPGEDYGLNFSSVYHPALTRNDFRLVTALDWKLVLSRENHLSLSLRLDHEYASDPDPDYPRNNTKITWGIQWDL